MESKLRKQVEKQEWELRPLSTELSARKPSGIKLCRRLIRLWLEAGNAIGYPGRGKGAKKGDFSTSSDTASLYLPVELSRKARTKESQRSSY